jgi:hypothetical protein
MLIAYRPYELTLTEVEVLSDYRNFPGPPVCFLYAHSRKSYQQILCSVPSSVNVVRGEFVDAANEDVVKNFVIFAL